MEGKDAMRPVRDTRLTYDDFLLFPDDGLRHELIDGEHYVTPCPNLSHQRLVGRIYAAFVFYLREFPAAGEALLAPFDVVFSRYDVVEPDLLFIAADQNGILTEKNVQGAPALVIEVLSPGTRKRDQTLKLRLFDRGGVREYWLVDPDANTITSYRRDNSGAFALAATWSSQAGDVVETPLLPAFRLALAELFR